MGRRRIPDKHNAGRSTIVHWKPGEDGGERHDRRLRENLHWRGKVEDLCNAWGISFEVKNSGHHWIFKHGKRVAEWWPSSAKLVLDKKWDSGIHTHDWSQVLDILMREFKPAKNGEVRP